jgi:phosphonopyruvate decarboxylase
MLDPSRLLDALDTHGVRWFAGVPDSLLADFCACIAARRGPESHLVAASEGGAIAAAIGHYVATGATPLVYMQNSGLGNAINPLLSLADPAVYAIPLILLIGWRGAPGERDEPQHVAQGRVTLPLLAAMEIPHIVVDGHTSDADGLVRDAILRQRSSRGPVAIVARKGTFTPFAAASLPPAPATALRQEQAIACLLDCISSDDLVVATTGMISRELYTQRELRGEGHARDFLVVGGMGHASQIALALAERQTARTVHCIDGDGALLMHMGGLAIVGARRPRNLRHVVLNNGVHESVGGQPTVALSMDLPAIAHAAGYASAARVDTVAALERELCDLNGRDGPAFLEVRIAPGHRSGLGRPASAPVDALAALMSGLR